ncbi:UNVERIFIED_CONTAM: hypothetical protein FKN15_033909 [Acipenser sinensis]
MAYFSLDWLSLAVDDGIRGDDTVRGGVSLYHFELHRPQPPTNQANITLEWRRMGDERPGKITLTHAFCLIC